VRKVAAVTGRDIRTARASLDEKQPAGGQLSRSTPKADASSARDRRTNIGRQLAIILDGRVQSAPRIDSAHPRPMVRINRQLHRRMKWPTSRSSCGRAHCRPGSTTCRSRRWPQPRRRFDPFGFLRIGGRPAADRHLHADLLQVSGINAVVLSSQPIILLGLMEYFGAVMTLPGIAGFVLTMGIGVDSNVLIFERIKEELEAEHGVRTSINAGFDR